MTAGDLQYLSCDGVKPRETVYVTSDFAKLKKEWAEAELGNMKDNDLRGYCGCPGKITEIEEDDDTVQLEWITMDTQWIPIAACVRDLPDADKRDAPISFVPRFNGTEADNMEKEISAQQKDSYKPPAEDYLDCDKVKGGEKIYVTNDLEKFKKVWKACELANLSDDDLSIYLGCPGKIIEVEEDDDTVQLEWITMDTQWIPVMACVRNLPDACKKDAPASFIPKFNGTDAENMEDEIAAKQAKAAAAGATTE